MRISSHSSPSPGCSQVRLSSSAAEASVSGELLPFQSWEEAEEYLGLDIADNARLEQMEKSMRAMSLGEDDSPVLAPLPVFCVCSSVSCPKPPFFHSGGPPAWPPPFPGRASPGRRPVSAFYPPYSPSSSNKSFSLRRALHSQDLPAAAFVAAVLVIALAGTALAYFSRVTVAPYGDEGGYSVRAETGNVPLSELSEDVLQRAAEASVSGAAPALAK